MFQLPEEVSNAFYGCDHNKNTYAITVLSKLGTN